MKFHPRRQRLASRQRGIVLVLVTLALTSVLGMAGLALDFGLAFRTKARVQNALDAAALAGAKSMRATGNTTTATNDARAAFNYYLGQLNRGSLTPTIQYFTSLVPLVAYTPSATPPNFIRVRMPAGYTIPTYLTRVFPSAGNTLTVGGSAVAGPVGLSPPGEVCNLTPLMISATVGPGGTVDSNCSDGACFGYTIGQSVSLKQGTTAGSGNFNLLALGGNGANIVRSNLAGGYNGCVTLGASVPVQTGAQVGPFRDGMNTRFGTYGGGLSSSDYPPDLNTNTSYQNYAAYLSALASGVFTNPVNGVSGRRIVRVVFGDFTTPIRGSSSDARAVGVGCFFLTGTVTGSGNNISIPAQFTNDCSLPNGGRSNETLATAGFFKIVLYKDPSSRDS